LREKERGKVQHGNTAHSILEKSESSLLLAAEQQLWFLSHPSQSPDKVVVASAATARASPESCCCWGIRVNGARLHLEKSIQNVISKCF